MSEWVRNAVFYHIYPLGFCGASRENHETAPVHRLDKLAEWIPHLKDLGVSAVYLGPVFQASGHGYDTRDYYQVDWRLGDNESFKDLCEQLHQAGIRIVLDGVFNHVGRQFWAFRDVQEKGPASPYCSWFHNLNFGGGSPMGDPFWYESWQGHYELVKLNLRNPQVVEHLLGAVSMWMDEFHIDGLRLDAADCMDFDFFRALRSMVKGKDPDFWLMGEIIHGDYSRWANPDMLDSTTNYECWKGLWSSHNSKNYFEIAHSLNRQFGPGGIYRGLQLYSFADNHDVNRVAGTLTDKRDLDNLYTILFTMPGVPSIYYGSEWALEDKRTPNSDVPLRPCLDLKEMMGRDQSLCAFLSRLAAIHRAFPALGDGEYENVIIRNEQLIYRRTGGGQRIYVALNLSAEEVYLDMPHGEPVLQDVLNDDEIFHNDGGRTWLPIPAKGARILVGAPDRFQWEAPQFAPAQETPEAPEEASQDVTAPEEAPAEEIPAREESAVEQTTPEQCAPETAAPEENAKEKGPEEVPGEAGEAPGPEGGPGDREKGLVHLYYGDGKGKTTAAFGLAVRCAGAGGQVVVAQFLKGANTGEAAAMERFPEIALLRGKSCGKFTFQMDQQELADTALECRSLLNRAWEEALDRGAKLLVLDEVVDACALELLPESALANLLDQRPAGLEVVLTGHQCPPALESRADYITRMAKERHPYDRGVAARPGIEY